MSMRFCYYLGASLVLASVVGCSDPQTGSQEEGASAMQATAVDAAAVDASGLGASRMDGAAMDETAECGAIAYLFSALPTAATLESLEEVYRGCDSALTAQLQYGGDKGSIFYSLAVLKPELAGLPADNASWLEVTTSNRQAMEELMAQQQADPNILTLELPQEGEGVLFKDAGDWTFAALIGDGHALRVEMSGEEWQQMSSEDAAQVMANLLKPIQFDQL